MVGPRFTRKQQQTRLAPPADSTRSLALNCNARPADGLPLSTSSAQIRAIPHCLPPARTLLRSRAHIPPRSPSEDTSSTDPTTRCRCLQSSSRGRTA